MLHSRSLFHQQRGVGGSPLIVPFPRTEQTTRTDVGGKAASLICMSEAGLPVPPGAVLASAFFAPWYDEVKASATWTKLIEASPDDWAPFCSELKKRALTLTLTVTQHDALHALLPDRVAASNEVRFAVRSSSPDEDLASASFAGGYERTGDWEHRSSRDWSPRTTSS